MKKTFTPDQKTAVVIATIKAEQTINQISSAYEVHPTQIGVWKKQALNGLKDMFAGKGSKEHQANDQLIAELYKTIGQRDMELQWLKKKLEPFTSSG